MQEVWEIGKRMRTPGGDLCLRRAECTEGAVPGVARTGGQQLKITQRDNALCWWEGGGRMRV